MALSQVGADKTGFSEQPLDTKLYLKAKFNSRLFYYGVCFLESPGHKETIPLSNEGLFVSIELTLWQGQADGSLCDKEICGSYYSNTDGLTGTD